MSSASVVIPTYNRAEVLPRAIESVLNQTYRDLELIVVDDASTDSTRELVTSYEDHRVNYIRHEVNKNGSAARNTGIQAATGEYVALLDSDDEWRREKLQRQITQLQNRSGELVGNYCGVEVKRSSRVKKFFANLFDHDATHEGQEEIIKGLLAVTAYVHGGSTLLAKRSVVDEIGGFDERFERHQDIEFTIRLAKAGRLGYIDEALVTLHESGRSSPDAIADAKEQLFETFADEIKCLESDGYEIEKIHRFVLARHYIGAGRIMEGLSYIPNSKPPNARQLVGMGLDCLRGTKKALA